MTRRPEALLLTAFSISRWEGGLAASCYGRAAARRALRRIGGVVIKHWVGVGCVALCVAAAPGASAQSPELLSFGKGQPVPAGDVARGQNVFNAVCWACHASNLEGAKGPPLTGPSFSKVWQGRPAGELADFIRNKMPTDDPGALSQQGARNVVAYILAYSNKPESLTGEESGK